MTESKKAWLIWGGLALLVAAACAARLLVGSAAFGWPEGEHARFILDERLRMLAIGATVGAALAVSGVALQALLRNPLAEPYILGLSTGAGAGMMLQALLTYWLMSRVGLFGEQFGALAGAGASMGIVYVLGRRHGLLDPLGLLLAGVVLSTINGALIMTLNYAVGPGGLRDDIARWMMGSLAETAAAPTIWAVVTLTAAGLAVLLAYGRAMDIATLSDAEAVSLGVNLRALRTVLFAVASVLAAGAVVLAGPIAFVGLICPHLARLVLGARHRPLLIGSALLGAALIVLADAASAGIAAMFAGFGRLPIGIFTALLGGPAFLWMLRPQLGRAAG